VFWNVSALLVLKRSLSSISRRFTRLLVFFANSISADTMLICKSHYKDRRASDRTGQDLEMSATNGFTAELQPTGTVEVSLPKGTIARLPVCYPVFSPWTGRPLGFDYGGKPALNYDGEVCFAELAISQTRMERRVG
jgi:hypothetical protein